jgi:phenol hydroxylase P3 protein
MPVHQIYQGNCGGATVPDVLNWYHLNFGVDNFDYADSQDRKNWRAWKGLAGDAEAGQEGEAAA